MERPPKTSESENIKKTFNLPGKQQVEWELDPRTGEILSLSKKDAEGNTVEFYDLEREEMAQMYENNEKAASHPAKPKRKTPAGQLPEQKTTEKNKTPNNWQQYGEIHNPKTNTTIDLYYNTASQHFREVVKNDDTRTILRYLERDTEGNITNFVNLETNGSSDLQAKLDRAKKDYGYFEDLKKLGWEDPTKQ